MKQKKLYVLTGFLGSGKTSLLLHLLDHCGDARVGVIQNEFGKVSIDGMISRRDGIEMTEISRGSIFCSCLKLRFVHPKRRRNDQPGFRNQHPHQESDWSIPVDYRFEFLQKQE